MTAYAAFRSRNYRFLLAGSVLSVLGQQMLSIVVAWDLYLATRSPVVLGNVGLVQVAPVLLLTLAAGHVADRYDRRRTLLCTQTLVAILALTLALSGSHRGVTLIYSCLFLGGIARSFQMPVTWALLPDVIEPGLLGNAISWNGSAREFATVVGPALAGAMLAWFGSASVYLAQAACSVLTILCFSSLRVPGARQAPAGQTGLEAVSEGIRFLLRDRLILSAILLDLLAVFFGGAVALLPIFAEDILHVGPTGLGWLRAAQAVGAGLTAFGLAHRGTIRRAGPVLLVAVAGFGAATIGFALSRSAWLSFLLLAATGALDSISVVLRSYLVQTRTPEHLRGRVNAVNGLFISCSNQLGAVESGWTAKWLGTVPSVAWGGVATLLVAGVIAGAFRQLRQWRNG